MSNKNRRGLKQIQKSNNPSNMILSPTVFYVFTNLKIKWQLKITKLLSPNMRLKLFCEINFLALNSGQFWH